MTQIVVNEAMGRASHLPGLVAEREGAAIENDELIAHRRNRIAVGVELRAHPLSLPNGLAGVVHGSAKGGIVPGQGVFALVCADCGGELEMRPDGAAICVECDQRFLPRLGFLIRTGPPAQARRWDRP